MKQLVFLLIILTLWSSCSSYNLKLENKDLDYFYIIKDKNDSLLLWLPLKYQINNQLNSKQYALSIKLKNNEKILTEINDYLLFENETLDFDKLYNTSIKAKKEFILVTNNIRLDQGFVDSIRLTTKISTINNLNKIEKTNSIIQDINKISICLNDSIFIRILNKNGETIDILKDRIDYK